MSEPRAPRPVLERLVEDRSALIHAVEQSKARAAACRQAGGCAALGQVHLSPSHAVPVANLLAEAPEVDMLVTHDGAELDPAWPHLSGAAPAMAPPTPPGPSWEDLLQAVAERISTALGHRPLRSPDA